MATAKLMTQGGPNDGLNVELKAGSTTLGRDATNDVPVVWDGNVSRWHARITHHLGLYWLEDLGSTNGTYLKQVGQEEQKLVPKQPFLLQNGATLRLGSDTRTRYEVVGVVANSNDDARRILLAYLREAWNALQADLVHLSPEMQQRQKEQIEAYAEKLTTAQSENELLYLAAEGIPTVAGLQAGDDAFAGWPDLGQQPPISDDVPAPNDANRLSRWRYEFVSVVDTSENSWGGEG